MVRSRARRIARAARWTAAFGAAAVLLGVGTPVLRDPAGTAGVRIADVSTDDALSATDLAALASEAQAVTGAAHPLHAAVPRGYRAPAPPVAPPVAAAPSTAPSPAPPPAVSTASAHESAPGPAPVPQAPAPPAGTALPLPVNAGQSTQVVTVVAPSAGSTRAVVTAWQRGPGGWTVAVGPVSARIGRDGVGTASESLWRTPAGTFTLTEAFGRFADPGTALPYRALDGQDWWVSDVNSRLYNQHARCAPAACPFNTSVSEHLVDENPAYDYAVVIDYNRWPAVRGKGSAFFLHVSNGGYTAGCVAIPQSGLVAIMRWLNPAARPLIAIGVG